MFEFRIIETADGNQIIDRQLKTPYNALTPTQMLEYIEIDNQLEYMKPIKKKQQRETERKRKFIYKFIHKIACIWYNVLKYTCLKDTGTKTK